MKHRLRYRLITCIREHEDSAVDDDIYVWEAWVESPFIQPIDVFSEPGGYVIQVRSTKRMFWDGAAFFISAQREALTGDHAKLTAA